MTEGLHTAYMAYLWSFWLTMPIAAYAAFHQRSRPLARIVAVMLVSEVVMGVLYPLVEQSWFGGDPRWFGVATYFLGGIAVVAWPAGKLQSIMGGLYGLGVLWSILALTRNWTISTDLEYTLGGVVIGLMMVAVTAGASTGGMGKRFCALIWSLTADRLVARYHASMER